MASLAGIGAADVGGGFAARNRAIMAAETSADHLGMIHRRGSHRGPIGREFLVAQLAFVTSVDMGTALATGDVAVVTTDAIIDKRTVVHASRNPGVGAMAYITLPGGRYMTSRFALGDTIVVATGANAEHL